MHLRDLHNISSRDELITVFESWPQTRDVEVYDDDTHDNEIISFLNDFYCNTESYQIIFNPDCLRSTLRSVMYSHRKIVSVAIVRHVKLNVGHAIEGFILCSRMKGLNLAFTTTRQLMLNALTRWPSVDMVFISSSLDYDLPFHSLKPIFVLPVNQELLLESKFCNDLPLKRYEVTKPEMISRDRMLELYDLMNYNVKYELDLDDMFSNPYLVFSIRNNGWACFAKKTFRINSHLIREYMFYVGGWESIDGIMTGLDCDVVTFHGLPPGIERDYVLRGSGHANHFWINGKRGRSNVVCIC